MTFQDLPGGPVVKTLPSSTEGAGSVLVGELRSYMPHGQKKQNTKQKQYCTNSINTIKMVHMKKKS